MGFLLRVILLVWLAFMAIILPIVRLSKTASTLSEIDFISRNFSETDYWRLDLFTGLTSKVEYTGSIITSDYGQIPVQHFLLLNSDANFATISELNRETQELREIWTYDTRHSRMLLAGDYIFLIDYTNHWSRVYIPTSQLSDFGQYPNLEYLQVSPNGQWLAGSNNNIGYFINILNGTSYEISTYWRTYWSPDSQWYIASSADNPNIVSVLNTENGSPHPILSSSFRAENATWGTDGQTIFFQNAKHLASISLTNGQLSAYPVSMDNFFPSCIAPNQTYILVSDGNNDNLIALDTGEIIWQIEGAFTVSPKCVWSEDSRYLISYYTVYNSGVNTAVDEWERFFVIDTQTGDSWDLYPGSLPSLPIYLHIPD